MAWTLAQRYSVELVQVGVATFTIDYTVPGIRNSVSCRNYVDLDI